MTKISLFIVVINFLYHHGKTWECAPGSNDGQCSRIYYFGKHQESPSSVIKYQTLSGHVTDIPMSRAYITQDSAQHSTIITDNGLHNFFSNETVATLFYYTDSPANFTLKVKAQVLPAGHLSAVQFSSEGIAKQVNLSSKDWSVSEVGRFQVKQAGYHKVDIRGISRTGQYFAEISDLIFEEDGALSHVKAINGNYKTCPSVHLLYDTPSTMEYFYNEIVVPKGYDPTYTFFNAGNFNYGYLGIQNFNKSGKEERVAIFSVWSPQETEDPKNVTEANKVRLVSKGTNVIVEPFGNEGTGLHAYVSYNWTTDVTYKFLVRGRPDSTDHTYSLYKAWFAPLNGTWLQIAEFRRPKSNGAYLGRALNFIENFETATGYLPRKALFGRQWARDGQGKWSEVTSTTFSSTEYNPVPRLDVQYGVTKVNNQEMFYMSTGGFRMTSDNPVRDAKLKRQAGTAQPDIDLNKLP